MRRFALLSSVALVVLAATGACTQNFDQFNPISSTGPGTGGSGDGGAPTATSTTTGTDATTTTTTTSTTTAGPGAEDCLNGEDDDGDGDRDCSDSDCGQYQCFEVPPGWRGPGVLYEGPPDQLPDCPGDFPAVTEAGGLGLIGEPAACTACDCGTPDVACEGTLTVYRNNTCDSGGPQADIATSSAVACAPLVTGFQIRSYRASTPTPNAAPCAPSGGTVASPPPTWTTQGRFCELDAASAGCDMGERCAPRQVDDPFEQAVCIFHEGEQVCPPGYDDQHVFAKDFIDTRGCTACGCSAPEASCTFGTTTIYSDITCTNALENAPNDDSCLADVLGGRSFAMTATANGSCQPNGGDAIGEVSESSDRTTVCCKR